MRHGSRKVSTRNGNRLSPSGGVMIVYDLVSTNHSGMDSVVMSHGLPVSQTKRRVMFDTNVLFSYIYNNGKEGIIRAAIFKAKNEDTWVISHLALKEIYHVALRSKIATLGDLNRTMVQLHPIIVHIDPKTEDELKESYSISDKKDLKILYSADMMNCDLIVCSDDDFYRDDVSGVDVTVMRPYAYVNEEGVRNGAKLHSNPKFNIIRKLKRSKDE